MLSFFGTGEGKNNFRMMALNSKTPPLHSPIHASASERVNIETKPRQTKSCEPGGGSTACLCDTACICTG